MQFGFDTIIQVIYFAAAFSFIYGLKKMSSPKTARKGIMIAGIAMAIATLATFFHSSVVAGGNSNYILMIVAISLGSIVAYLSGKMVKMTDMPQMIALYNGMGGGAAAAIAAIELIRVSSGTGHGADAVTLLLATLGAMIGMVSFSGSSIAFAKLQGLIDKAFVFPGQRVINLLLFLAMLALGAILVFSDGHGSAGILIVFFAVACALGVLLTLPIGGADMPVVISLYNALTGLAVAFEGFVLQNPAMIIAGTVVGAAGTLLTQLMAKAMNRPISNVLFSQMTASSGTGSEIDGVMKESSAEDAASLMAFANQVIIVPGYGMAVAQAQHKVAELAKTLESNGVDVKFAIHPVAGRMPGHMNVLLAEAGIDYDKIYDLEDINSEFPITDAVLVIGANDVVNPVAKTDKDSPIYGMPILDVSLANNVLVIKRGKGKGFSGVENTLFYADNTRMVYGDGSGVVASMITAAKDMVAE